MDDGGFGPGLFDGLCPAVPASGLDALGCTLAAWELPILVGLALVLLGGALWVLRRRARKEEATPFVLPIHPDAAPAPRPRPTFPDPSPAPAPAQAPPPRATPSGVPIGEVQPPTTPRSEGPEAHAGSHAPAPEAMPLTPGTVRFESPPEGTLQLLPGRLEIQSGPGSGGEIRFVRLPGAEQEITFGRSEGPRYRHVELGSPTVSRQHARLLFRDGRWTLRNESATNPTVHNGRPLGAGHEEVPLTDGDRVEMGEIRFLFRQSETRDRLASRSSWYTDRGRRSVNQDAVLVRTLPDGRELAAVCDGMGSHSASGIASHIAIDALVAALLEGADLQDAVRTANERVFRAASEGPGQEGMGTTLVAALLVDGRYEIVNVGDSRAYRLDDTGIRQVTRDHSFVSEMVDQGKMSRDDAERSPWKNAVTRCLGAESEVEVDLFEGRVEDAPVLLLLCSDGVHGMLEDEEIAAIASGMPDVRELARALGERALVKGGEDNVAAAVLRIDPGPAADAAGRGRPQG